MAASSADLRDRLCRCCSDPVDPGDPHDDCEALMLYLLDVEYTEPDRLFDVPMRRRVSVVADDDDTAEAIARRRVEALGLTVHRISGLLGRP
jgi:hypothetical protein